MQDIEGLTLIEVVVAIFVLSMGIMSWAVVQRSQIYSRAQSKSLETGIDLAQARIEELSARATQQGNCTQFACDKTKLVNGLVYTIGSECLEADLGDSKVLRLVVVVSWTRWAKRHISLERVVVKR